MSIQQYKPGESPARVSRGSACLSCRRRKMRCDGVKPVCGQCVHMEREYDCEYTDGPMPSPTQLLERDVARLEARIKKLESDTQVARRAPNKSHSPSRQASPTESSSTLSNPLNVSEGIVPTDPAAEVHQTVIRLLVGIFVPHASQVGFFLSFSRFLDAVYLPDSAARRTVLSPALLDAVLLWGAHFSNNGSLRTHEATFLSRAVTSLASGASLQDLAIQTIQAEILLANYFFCQSRTLEGTYHCSAAVALALSCKLNVIRSVAQAGSPDPTSTGIFTLAPAVDAVEEGERINAFWSTYILDRGWSVAQGSHANDVFLGVRIDTPWPQETSSYEQGALPAELRTSDTMHSFLNEPVSDPTYEGFSTIALRAKAAALFEGSTRLASQWTHGLQPFLELPLEADQVSLTPAMPDFDGFYMDVYRLDALLRSFTATLLPLNRSEAIANAEVAANLLVTHTYARAAAIRLHAQLESAQSTQERHDLTAAKAAADAIDNVRLDDLPFLDPMLAVLWGIVGQVFINSIKRLDQGRLDQRQSMLLYLRKVTNAMAMYSRTSDLMASQLAQLQGDLAMLTIPGVPSSSA